MNAMQSCVIVDGIIENGFKGLGEKKLSALSEDVLRELVVRVGCCDRDACTELAKEDMVRTLLRIKRDLASKGNEPVEKAGASSEPTAAFSSRHSIEIVAFNALKLRLDKADVEPVTDSFAARMAQADIVVMSEVPAGAKAFVKRVGLMLEGLKAHSREKWSYCVSDASGPGPKEVHLVLYKSPLQLLKHTTTFQCNGTQMDHSPITALFEDTRFSTHTRFVVSSVHFPPSSRSKQRDAQIAAFLDCYTAEASLRCDTPMTDRGARDARVKLPTHIIAGDFNTWIGDDRYRAQCFGFETMLGKNIGTTSGKRAFDNFLVSRHTRDNFALSTSVLELSQMQNSHRGVTGLSDHSPISMTLQM